MTAAETPPQVAAAQHYMQRKGYESAQPAIVDKVQGSAIWYFRYDLGTGELELEVMWDEESRQWVTSVTTFARKSVEADEGIED